MATREQKIATATRAAEAAGEAHLLASLTHGDLSDAADNALADAQAARAELDYVKARASDDE